MKDRIRTIRTGLGLTQKEFAAKIGTSQNVLANYETGRRNPSSSVINNICKTFHINESWLRAGEGAMSAEVSMEQKIITWVKEIFAEEEMTFQKRFLHMLMGLDDSKWKLLEEMLQNTIGNLPNQKFPQENPASPGSTAYAAPASSRRSPQEDPAGPGSMATSAPAGSQGIPQEGVTVSDAEAAYIKSRSKNAANGAFPVSSFTAGEGNAKKKIN